MKKISKSAELLWIFGIVFVALGVSLCSKADLGVSMIAAPAFVIYEAIAPLWQGFSVGMTEYLIQGVLLIVMCFAVKSFRVRYLFAFLVAVLYGYVLNFFLWIFGDLTFTTAVSRYFMLILGDVITALGVACFFRTYMPLQVYELFVAEIAKKYSLKIGKVKWCFDLSLLAVSLTLAFTLFADVKSFDWSKILTESFHSIGMGTLITTAINSPIIVAMGKLLDRIFDPTPAFPNLKSKLAE